MAFTTRMMAQRRGGAEAPARDGAVRVDRVVPQVRFCIKNDGFCTTNDGFYIYLMDTQRRPLHNARPGAGRNDGFCI